MTALVEAAAGAAAQRSRWLTFGLVAAAVLLSDQISKRWVDASFGLAWSRGPVPGLVSPTPLLGDWVRIAKSYNDGGIFGLFGSSAPILAVASLVVIALIVWYEARSAREGPWPLTLVLGLLLGGALGNLTDRLRLGYVIDFVDMGVGGLRFYTFNVADASISVAIAGLILMAFLGDRLERDRARADRAGSDPTPGAR